MILSEICRDIALSADGDFISIIISLILLAFVGSFAHCTLMCGPFVMAQVANNSIGSSQDRAIKHPQAGEWSRLKGAALLPYHLGRISTYSLLGGTSAVIGSQITEAWSPFAGILLFATGLIMVAYSLKPKLVNNLLNVKLTANFTKISYIKKILNNLTLSHNYLKGYTLGIILGFIPCAMVYIALTATASLDNFYEGFIAMMAFGIATTPALFVLGLLGKYITEQTKEKTKLFNKVSLVVAGIWLCYIAINILIIK